MASLLELHHPGLVLSTGFAGGLQAGLKTGALVVCDGQVACWDGEANGLAPLELDGTVAETAAGLLDGAGAAARRERLLTVPEPLLSPVAKQRAGQETGAAVVDMEGYWLAKAMRERRTPLLLLRVVLDTAEQALPRFVDTIVADQGRNEWGHAARGLLSNPFSLAGMASMAARSLRAQAALRRAVRALAPRLTNGLASALEQRGAGYAESARGDE